MESSEPRSPKMRNDEKDWMHGNRRLYLHSVERFDHKIPYCIDMARDIWQRTWRDSFKTRAHYAFDICSQCTRFGGTTYFALSQCSDRCFYALFKLRAHHFPLFSFPEPLPSALFSHPSKSHKSASLSAIVPASRRVHSPKTTKASPKTPT